MSQLHPWRNFWLKWYRYAHIARYQAYANLRGEVERTYLGVAWLAVQPILSATVFFVIFSFLLPSRGDDYFAVVLVGTFAWEWFASSLSLASMSIVNKAGLMQQVYIPKLLFPLVSVLNGCWKSAVSFLILLFVLPILGHFPTLLWFALPVLILLQAGLILGLAFLLSALTPFFADSRALVEAGLRLLLYFSGVFYTASHLPPAWQGIFLLNPVAILLESYRAILLGGASLNSLHLLYLAGFVLALNVAGLLLLHRLDLHLPKQWGNA
jgi:lipopolysaccharide transport system permease protein